MNRQRVINGCDLRVLRPLVAVRVAFERCEPAPSNKEHAAAWNVAPDQPDNSVATREICRLGQGYVLRNFKVDMEARSGQFDVADSGAWELFPKGGKRRMCPLNQQRHESHCQLDDRGRLLIR
jgi:hypothetical protein